MARPSPFPSQTPVDTAGVKLSVPWQQWFAALIAPFMFIPAAAAAFNVSASNGDLQKFITSGNTTITLPPSAAGQKYTVLIQYGGTHTITFSGPAVRWVGGVQPTATSVLGKIDIYEFICDGVNVLGRDGGRNL